MGPPLTALECDIWVHGSPPVLRTGAPTRRERTDGAQKRLSAGQRFATSKLIAHCHSRSACPKDKGASRVPGCDIRPLSKEPLWGDALPYDSGGGGRGGNPGRRGPAGAGPCNARAVRGYKERKAGAGGAMEHPFSILPTRVDPRAAQFVSKSCSRGSAIELLLDRDAPFLELCALAGHGVRGASAGGGVVGGVGVVSGVECLITASEATVKGGAVNELGVKKRAASPRSRGERAPVRQPHRVRGRRPPQPAQDLRPGRRRAFARSRGAPRPGCPRSAWCSAARPRAAPTSPA
jgi:hypothetical protein